MKATRKTRVKNESYLSNNKFILIKPGAYHTGFNQYLLLTGEKNKVNEGIISLLNRVFYFIEEKELNPNRGYELEDLFDITFAPGGKITVAVRSDDTNVVDVAGNKLRIVGLGKTKLVFYPVLNPNLACEIEIVIEDKKATIGIYKNNKSVTKINSFEYSVNSIIDYTKVVINDAKNDMFDLILTKNR